MQPPNICSKNSSKLKTYMQKYSFIIRICIYWRAFLQEIHRFLRQDGILFCLYFACSRLLHPPYWHLFCNTCDVVWHEDMHKDSKKFMTILLKGLPSLYRVLYVISSLNKAFFNIHLLISDMPFCNSGLHQYLYTPSVKTLSHCNPVIFQSYLH